MNIVDECIPAVWARPENAWPTWWQMSRVGLLATPGVIGLSATWQLLRFHRVLETTRRRLLNAPHWYLFAIGVPPERKGQGLGGAMLRRGVEKGGAFLRRLGQRQLRSLFHRSVADGARLNERVPIQLFCVERKRR